ncbi:OmpA-like domain-containing protein [Synechococcus sp. MIT S9220]|nr:OmpA-like domain-containing protein [Synechococcus sp. MIT S9220]
MKKRFKISSQKDHVTWMPMTDMLSSTLMITFLFIAVSTILRAMNAKPPIISLEDTEDYRFRTGSFILSQNFEDTLKAKAIPNIESTIKCYGIDTIEIVGHTDGRPSTPGGNIDMALVKGFEAKDMSKVIPGSNIDLGFLRAMAVQDKISNILTKRGVNNIGFRVLSAGSTINIDGRFSPAKNKDDKARRRIEIRFLRRSKTPFIPKCS